MRYSTWAPPRGQTVPRSSGQRSWRTNKLFRGGWPSALVLPLRPLDADQGADTSVARGIQRWPPATAPKIKPTNRTTATKSVDAKVQVAIAYATNCDDVERILLLQEPVPPDIEP